VSPEKFDELLKSQFGTPNPGSAWERTMQQAINTGKIQRGEMDWSDLGKTLQKMLGIGKVDLSVVKKGGPFDNPPFIELPK
jgi:hypothetical protein